MLCRGGFPFSGSEESDPASDIAVDTMCPSIWQIAWTLSKDAPLDRSSRGVLLHRSAGGIIFPDLCRLVGLAPNVIMLRFV